MSEINAYFMGRESRDYWSRGFVVGTRLPEGSVASVRRAIYGSWVFNWPVSERGKAREYGAGLSSFLAQRDHHIPAARHHRLTGARRMIDAQAQHGSASRSATLRSAFARSRSSAPIPRKQVRTHAMRFR